ncbi:hypothetical protein KFL_005950050 [Klebsormidium nitens]|uniref:Uncharacterized protein n=1 Tax=Klebsormidium nitens TaxID=105231 RepID=A0A1Y1IPL4_KLENI|nr:hypothetical protein KFL_005950050 [Klebsormidium nitens]|eukprot:GAQ90068.1 hypothetical protein KFL_005950050 [Klebsormidium nitens]
MAPTRQNSACSRVDTGLKGVLAGAPEEQSQAGRPSAGTIVGKASAATTQFCRLVRRGCEDATQARDQVRLCQKDLAKRPPWGSGLTPGKQQRSTPLRVGPPSRHSRSSLAAHPHCTHAAETPGEAALSTKRTLSFVPAPAQLDDASAPQGPTLSRSAGAAEGEEAIWPPHHGVQGSAVAAKQTKKQMGDVHIAGKQLAQVDPGQANAASLAPSSPRSPLDLCTPQTDVSRAVADSPPVPATAQQTGASGEADAKHRAPLEAKLAQAQAERATLQAALEKKPRFKESHTVRQRSRSAFSSKYRGRPWMRNERDDAEARAQAALESARAELSIAATEKEEAQTRARAEALKRQQTEAEVESMARECAALRASLTEEQAARAAAAEGAEGERERGREDADVALHASAETIARLEGELARARSDAAAAACKLEEVAAKAQALATQLEQAQVASRQSLADAAATASKERASARALVAAAEARLAAVDKKAAAAEQEAAEARALLDSEKARATLMEEQLEQLEARRLEALELAEKEAARLAQVEASLVQTEASLALARGEEANARAQEREAELVKEIEELRAAEVKWTESNARLEAEMGRRLKADAKASNEEARRRKVEQRLADGENARAYLESKLREAEGITRAAEAAWEESEAKRQALNDERGQWKVAECKLEEQAAKREAAESMVKAATARAEDAERKLEEAREQLAHKVTKSTQSLTASSARVAELEAELYRARAAHVALETKCATAAARVAELQETVADKEADIAEGSRVIQELMAQLSELTSDNIAEERRLRDEVTRAQAEVAKLKRALLTAQTALKKASAHPSKSNEELERENSKLKQENTKLQTAADVAAVADAADRRAFKAHLETEREHGETLIEQLRVKNEEVDSLEAEVLFLKQQQNETSNYRELRAYTMLHELGGKMNEIRHKLTQLLVSFQEPGPSSAHSLAFIHDELARLRASLDAEHEEDMDVAGPSSSHPPASPQQGAPDKSVNDTEVGDCGLTGWGEVDDAIVLVDTGSDAVDAA